MLSTHHAVSISYALICMVFLSGCDTPQKQATPSEAQRSTKQEVMKATASQTQEDSTQKPNTYDVFDDGIAATDAKALRCPVKNPEEIEKMSAAQLIGIGAYYTLYVSRESVCCMDEPTKRNPQLEPPVVLQSPTNGPNPKFTIQPSIGLDETTIDNVLEAFDCVTWSPEIEQLCEKTPLMCRPARYNALSQLMVGGDLFKKPSELDVDVLKRILQKIWVEPETPMLGVATRQVYAFFLPNTTEYLASYDAIKDYSETKAKEVYSKALKKHGLESNERMMTFYEELAKHPKLKGNPRILGFWLRRFHDGSAHELAAFLRKVQGAYDKSQ